jgi:hypothetical protein
MRSRAAVVFVLFSLACSDPLAPRVEQHAFSAPTSVTEITRLAGLGAQQAPTVLLHSEGCFHYLDAELRFTAASHGIEVSGRVWNRGGNEVIEPRLLTRSELGALEEELDAVRRAPSEGICTTTTTYELTWQEGPGVSRVERIQDHTCALFRKYWSADGLARGPATSFTMLAGEALYRTLSRK